MSIIPTAHRIREELDSVLDTSAYISARRDDAGAIKFAAIRTDQETATGVSYEEEVCLDDLFSSALQYFRIACDASRPEFVTSLYQLSHVLTHDCEKAQEQIYSEEYDLRNRQFGRSLLSFVGLGHWVSAEVDAEKQKTILRCELEKFKLRAQSVVVAAEIARCSDDARNE